MVDRVMQFGKKQDFKDKEAKAKFRNVKKFWKLEILAKI